MVSVRLSPLLEPLRAPPFAAETGSNRGVMIAMAVTVRCAVMVGEGVLRGLSSLFYSSNCSRVTALSPCAMLTAVKPEIICFSPLIPPKITKIAYFLKKHHEKFGGVQKSHYLCNRLRQVRAFSSAGLEHLPYKQRVGGSNPSTPTIKQSLTKKFVRLFLFLTAFIQTFSILLLYNSGKRVNFAV